MTEQRARLLRAAVGFALVPPAEPELQLLHRWLDSWRGIGDVVRGMARQGYDLELRRFNGQGWRALFFPEGFEHPMTSHTGAGWAPSPWQAVQRAAKDALRKIKGPDISPHDWTAGSRHACRTSRGSGTSSAGAAAKSRA